MKPKSDLSFFADKKCKICKQQASGIVRTKFYCFKHYVSFSSSKRKHRTGARISNNNQIQGGLKNNGI